MTKKQKFVHILSERLRPGLQDVERKYLESCELGDENFVKNVLNSGRVSADIEDTQGRTGLDISIENGHVSLVDYLLSKVSPKVIHQGLLCAIEYDREEICEILLNHPIYQTTHKDKDGVKSNEYSTIQGITSPNGVTTPDDDDLSMRSDISKFSELPVFNMLKEALIKAAIRNDFQIVQMIMMKGALVDIPHDYFCSCTLCIEEQNRDYMVFCNRRLDTFRALASPDISNR